MNIRKLHVGRWVRVKFDDIGVRDGILVSKDHHTDPKPLMCKVFFPLAGIDIIEPQQIIAIGNYVNAKEAGIPELVT